MLKLQFKGSGLLLSAFISPLQEFALSLACHHRLWVAALSSCLLDVPALFST